MNWKDITIKELEEFAKQQNMPTLNIPRWKILVKDFGTRHELNDREAVDVARLAREMRKPIAKIVAGLEVYYQTHQQD